jgi:hypothetical protein
LSIAFLTVGQLATRDAAVSRKSGDRHIQFRDETIADRLPRMLILPFLREVGEYPFNRDDAAEQTK